MIEKSKFTILQEQISPHFLYDSLDTLDTILICTMMDKKEAACGLIKSLSSFYRLLSRFRLSRRKYNETYPISFSSLSFSRRYRSYFSRFAKWSSLLCSGLFS